MLETVHFRRAVWTGLFGLMFVVAACDKGGSGATDTAAVSPEHGDDSTQSTAPVSIEPSRAVDSETLAYADVDDRLAYGYLAYPSGMTEPLPAIIMIHEWWGLNDNIRAMANRFAAEGYMVLAVDLYGGETADSPREARERMRRVVENPETARENIRQALNFLNIAGAPGIAAIGWGFGGGWSLNTAMQYPGELDASVIIYGQVTDDHEKLRVIDAPVLGLFAAKDRGIPIETINAFDEALQRLRMKHEIHIYPDVGHAFANPTGNRYNQEAAEDAWQRTIRFLGENMSSGDET